MNLNFKILFITEILHSYYAAGNSKDFEVVPSAETALLLKNQGMMYKVVGNKLLVVANCDGASKPVVKLNAANKFSFYLKLLNGNFNNITNIEYKPNELKRFYFSNINQTKINSVLYLTKKIPAYNSATAYTPGSLAANGIDEIFEAVKSSNNANAHGLGETSFWHKKDKKQYATANDLIQLSATIYNFSVTPAKLFTIDIFGLNTATNNYDVAVTDTKNVTFDDIQSVVDVKLNGLPAGKYRLVVNGEAKEIYYDNQAALNSIFGIVEIFNHLPAANDFSLLDAADIVKEKTFTLHFASRSVIWKYLARTADITSVKDSSNSFTFSSPAAKIFTSVVPISLSEKPIKTFFLESLSLGNITPVANPGNNRLSTITQAGDVYYCAETYLNY
jgi:hypothetical protein